MKLKEAVKLYKALGEANINALEDEDLIVIVNVRKTLRAYVNDYDAFVTDCQEKFKPDNWIELQLKVAQWKKEGDKTTLTDEEKIEINTALVAYQNKIEKAVSTEDEKELDVELPKLSETAITRILKYNGWSLNKLDDLAPII